MSINSFTLLQFDYNFLSMFIYPKKGATDIDNFLSENFVQREINIFPKIASTSLLTLSC